jgi:hypothetical protein
VATGIGGFAMDGEAEWNDSGAAVSGAGDLDDDGLIDVIVGAPRAEPNGTYSGRTYVVFGKADTDRVSLADVAQGTGGFTMDGEAEYAHSGLSVSGAGDVNGDGIPDLIVGALGADPNGIYSGRTYVVFGKANADAVSLADVAQGTGGFALDGEIAYSHSGCSVAGIGDINGDGLDDVIVGSSFDTLSGSSIGRAYVVFGKADTQAVALADIAQGGGGFALDGEDGRDYAGQSVAGAGDVNGDGVLDMVVGAPRSDASGPWAGRSYVVFGKADNEIVLLADVAQGIGGFAMDGEAENDHSGQAVSAAGDVNGDGLADVIVGAPSADANGNGSGRIYVVFGRSDTTLVPLADVVQGIGGFALDGEEYANRAGHSVSGAGDINGDGLADVVVGAPTASPSDIEDAGRIYVVFGKTDTEAILLSDVAQGIGGFVLNGEAVGDQAGSSVRGATDVNNDGVPDLVVGAPHVDGNGLYNSGRTYVVFGGDFSCEGG